MTKTNDLLIDYLLDSEPDNRILCENPYGFAFPVHWDTIATVLEHDKMIREAGNRLNICVQSNCGHYLHKNECQVTNCECKKGVGRYYTP